MAKRDFRTVKQQSGGAHYPTLDDVDTDRRRFLGGLGAIFGAGVIGSALAACGDDRRVNTHSSADSGPKSPTGPKGPTGPELAGGAPMPPAPADAGVPRPDIGHEYPPEGEAPMPDAKIDRHDAGAPDAEWPMAGDAPAPDAAVDPAPDWGMAGGISEPDAGVDKPDMTPAPDVGVPLGGVAPAPDAAIDDGGESCPNP